MTYRPKQGEDAITKGGCKAAFLNYIPYRDLPFSYKVGDTIRCYNSDGTHYLIGDFGLDLVGKWEDPQPKAKKLKWVKVAKGLTVAGGYDIAKRDVDFELTCFDMESRGSTYLGIFPTKKAAKAAAQEDADKL